MKKPDFADEIVARVFKEVPWLKESIDPKTLMAVAYIVGKSDGAAMIMESVTASFERAKLTVQ